MGTDLKPLSKTVIEMQENVYRLINFEIDQKVYI